MVFLPHLPGLLSDESRTGRVCLFSEAVCEQAPVCARHPPRPPGRVLGAAGHQGPHLPGNFSLAWGREVGRPTLKISEAGGGGGGSQREPHGGRGGGGGGQFTTISPRPASGLFSMSICPRHLAQVSTRFQCEGLTGVLFKLNPLTKT